MIKRLFKPIESNSFFLLGSRGTGKSTWLKAWMKDKRSIYFDLLDPELENKFLTNPQDFKLQILKELEKNDIEWIIVDEIQKCPALLNYAHMFIEDKKIKFALSGSSARRLKQKGTNLLAGRAFIENLFPFTHLELGNAFKLNETLTWGSLPKVTQLTTQDERKSYLQSYALSYIQNEIQAEQWVRNLTPFRKFLPVAAQMNNKILNYSNIANDIGVDWTTVKNYFDILEDCLVGYRLESYDESVRKRQRKSPKFYFFDIGFKKALENSLMTIPSPRTTYYGESFEHFIFLEIYRLNIMKKKDFELFYLCTKDNVEVDIILRKRGLPLQLIEIKSTEHVLEGDTRALETIGKSFPRSRKILLSNDTIPKKINSVDALPWEMGLHEIMS